MDRHEVGRHLGKPRRCCSPRDAASSGRTSRAGRGVEAPQVPGSLQLQPGTGSRTPAGCLRLFGRSYVQVKLSGLRAVFVLHASPRRARPGQLLPRGAGPGQEGLPELRSHLEPEALAPPSRPWGPLPHRPQGGPVPPQALAPAPAHAHEQPGARRAPLEG